MELRLFFLFVIPCLITVMQPVNGASFDCSKATRSEEKLICSNTTLSELDTDLNVTYQNAREKLSEEKRSKLAKEQQTWLKDWVRVCGIPKDSKMLILQNTACPIMQYRARIEALLRLLPLPKNKTIDVIIPAKLLGNFWGVELPVEGVRVPASMSSSLYFNQKEGRLLISFSYSERNSMSTHYLLYDIAQKKIIHSEKKNLKKRSKKTPQDNYLEKNGFVALRGARLRSPSEVEGEFGFVYQTPNYDWTLAFGKGEGLYCYPPVGYKTRIRDLLGRVVSEKTILYASHKKISYSSDRDCDEEVSTVKPLISVAALSVEFIWTVDDGTILAGISDAPYFVRLTPKLTSPFIEHHPDIRFFPTGILEPWLEQEIARQQKLGATERDIHQRVDDALFNFVQRHEKNRTTKMEALK